MCPCAPIPLPPSHGWGGVGASAATPSVCNMPQAENHPIQGEGLAVAGEKMLVGLKTLSGGGIR